jgi:hypothetical protein
MVCYRKRLLAAPVEIGDGAVQLAKKPGLTSFYARSYSALLQ